MPYIVKRRVYEYSRLMLYKQAPHQYGTYLVLWEVQRDKLKCIRRELRPLLAAYKLYKELATHIEQYECEKAINIFHSTPHHHPQGRVPQWELQPESIREAFRIKAWR